MTELEIHLKRIQDKLQQVLKQQSSLQNENLRLKKDLEKSNKQILVYQQNIDDLKQQVEVLKITSGNWDETDKKEFEKRINNHIKEIDRCIAFLST
jgi:NAD-dependent SIR2 family protein deacetylase